MLPETLVNLLKLVNAIGTPAAVAIINITRQTTTIAVILLLDMTFSFLSTDIGGSGFNASCLAINRGRLTVGNFGTTDNGCRDLVVTCFSETTDISSLSSGYWKIVFKSVVNKILISKTRN